MILAVVTGGVDVAGGAPLGADHLLAQIVQGHVGAFLDDDHLHALGVGVREVHDHLAVLVDGNTGHHDVGLALLHSQQRGVEVHVVHDQLQAQLLGDGAGDFHVDALERAVIGDHLVGREGGVGGHDQLTRLDGGESSGGSLSLGGGGSGLSRGGSSGGLRGLGLGSGGAAASQHSSDHQSSQDDGKQLFHNHYSPFLVSQVTGLGELMNELYCCSYRTSIMVITNIIEKIRKVLIYMHKKGNKQG